MKLLLALVTLMMLGGCVPCDDGHTFGLTRAACGLDRTHERRIAVCQAFCGADHGVLEVASSYRENHVICTCDDNRQKEVF